MNSILGSKTVFTTGEIAKIFDVNINTVVKWFETGLLEGYKLPGSQARRVPRGELIDFLAKRNLPVVSAPGEPVVVLLLSSQPDMTRQFRAAVESAFGYELYCASDAFQAGLVCAERVPEVIFVHLGHTDFDLAEFRRSLGRRPRLAGAGLIALAQEDLEEGILAERGFASKLVLPVRSEAILDIVDTTVVKNRSASAKFPSLGH